MAENKNKDQLFLAVEAGNFANVKRLTSTPRYRNLKNWSPGFDSLFQSLRNKELEIAKALVNHGCSVEQQHFIEAAKYADVELIQMIRQNVCRRKNYKNEVHALHLFAQRPSVDEECKRVLEILLSIKGNAINIIHTPSGYIPIHYAAECGNGQMIALLLSKGSKISIKTKEGLTPLHLAVLKGHSEVVRVLLEHNVDHKIKDPQNRTALCLAVERKDLPTIEVFLKSSIKINTDSLIVYRATEARSNLIVEKLLKGGASANYHSLETGKTPLHLAVERGDQELVSVLLKYKAKPNIGQISAQNSKEDDPCIGYTGLHIAADKENLEMFNLLLNNKGIRPGTVDAMGQTCLHLATKNGSLPIAMILLSRKYKHSLFTYASPDGYTPLHIAVENGQEDFVTVFLDAGISANSATEKGYMPLHLACSEGNLSMVKLLLKYEADPSAQGPSAMETPLFFAAKVGSWEIVDIISEISSNRTGEWQEGYFSLFVAAYHGHEGVVKKLIKKGVDPNASIRNYLTPLQAAAQQGHEIIVKILLEHQADVNSKCDDGNDRFSTPLISACLSGNEAIVEILLNQGADVNAKVVSKPKELTSKEECLLTYGYYSFSEVLSKEFKAGYTPLHFAAESGKREVVEMIVKRGADVNARAEDNSTPLYVATKKQHEDLVSYLLESGASTANAKGVLLKAIVLKNAKIVKLLLKYRTPLKFTFSFKNMKEYTPLLLAIMESNVEIIEVLLKEGSTVDHVCSKGLTPIFHAVAAHKTNAVKALAKHGASLNFTTRNGISLLHFALNNNVDEDMIKLIVECGVDLHILQDYNSPIERICNGIFYRYMSYNLDRMLRIFLRNGLDVNSEFCNSRATLLHYATYDGTADLERAELLLQHGADFNLLNRKGRTPFYHALRHNIQHSYAIVRAIIKTEAQGGYICPENLELMKIESKKDYSNHCKTEIQKMKLRKITSQVSYFTILTADEENLAVYAEDENIIKAMESTDLKLYFPLYHEDLKFFFDRGLARKKLLNVSHRVLNEILNKELPSLIVDEILKNLRFVDLKNLCRSRYPIMFLSSDQTESY